MTAFATNRTPLWSLIFMVLYCGTAALAQNASVRRNPPIAMRATHLLGLEGAQDNASGTLSIQGDALRFRKDGKPAVGIKVNSITGVLVGEQSREVGGVPMTLGKAAAPYGGGRLVSLFAHKRYDILSVQYVDTEGGVHGSIFQLNKGQGEVFRNELASHGALLSLCTADGTVVLERTMNGNVRFMGSNLRATHNLAHNVAKLIQQSSLPEPSHWARKNGGQL